MNVNLSLGYAFMLALMGLAFLGVIYLLLNTLMYDVNAFNPFSVDPTVFGYLEWMRFFIPVGITVSLILMVVTRKGGDS